MLPNVTLSDANFNWSEHGTQCHLLKMNSMGSILEIVADDKSQAQFFSAKDLVKQKKS